jgi:hypothetical protein
VLDRTRRLWDKQNQLVGDRHQLLAAVAAAVEGDTVLYAGSFVDVSPSSVWPSVTYVDADRRAGQFFADHDGVCELLRQQGANPRAHSFQFIRADYRDPLDLGNCSFDLLISLYAGFVSEYCTRCLRVGGTLLVNPSHGDAAMASIDPPYRLSGVLTSGVDSYAVNLDDLDAYLIPKRDIELNKERLHRLGRGIAYTTSPFAYLFQRVN